MLKYWSHFRVHTLSYKEYYSKHPVSQPVIHYSTFSHKMMKLGLIAASLNTTSSS